MSVLAVMHVAVDTQGVNRHARIESSGGNDTRIGGDIVCRQDSLRNQVTQGHGHWKA